MKKDEKNSENEVKKLSHTLKPMEPTNSVKILPIIQALISRKAPVE
jgi:hypothetical protein